MGLQWPRGLLLPTHYVLRAAYCSKPPTYVLLTKAHFVADLVVVEPQALAQAALVLKQIGDDL